jgi:formamidopyrimidine-DNA glycosylase
MPELPEVETLRRQLVPEVSGRTILTGRSHPSSKFVEARDLSDVSMIDVHRRGKYLLFELEDDRELVVHLGMTGQLRLDDAGDIADDYERAAWLLDDGRRLVFRDVRRFGRIAVVDAGEYRRLPTLHALGPEPFDEAFSPQHLRRSINASDRRIKTQLLSQRTVAGVGNIYADEALWRARVNPTWRRITLPEAERLRNTIVDVLREGIEHGGTTLRDYRTVDGEVGGHQHHIQCYGRADQPCERCGDPLVSRQLDARTTTWCRTCQKR